MPVTQQQPIFTPEEAERFATLWAGFDVCNSNDAEAKSKGNALRRMMAGKKFQDGNDVRLVDALELLEIRVALDDQMQPARQSPADNAALMTENEDLRNKLAAVVPEVTRLADALTLEQELNARLQGRPQQNRSIAGPFVSGVLALALAVECVLAVIGLFGGHEPAHVSEAASITLPHLNASATLPEIKPAEEMQPAMKQEYRPDARRRRKAKPVPEVVPDVVLEMPEAVPPSRHPFHWQQFLKAFEEKEGQSKRRDQGQPAVRVVPESKF